MGHFVRLISPLLVFSSTLAPQKALSDAGTCGAEVSAVRSNHGVTSREVRRLGRQYEEDLKSEVVVLGIGVYLL